MCQFFAANSIFCSLIGTELKEDINSHWAILNVTNSAYNRGYDDIFTLYEIDFNFVLNWYRKPIKCGDVIRLQHLATNKNLHSHHFSSPLSGNQEISCYGEEGVGDSGDHWKVICSDDFWLRSNTVKFFHIDTDVYLSVSGRTFGR